MAKKSKSGSKGKRADVFRTQGTVGRSMWAKGSKLELLEARKGQWKEAKKIDKTGPFYAQTAMMIIQQYGFDLAHDEEGTIIKPACESTCAEVLQFPDDMPEEEREEKVRFFDALRTKIGNWYRYQMTTVNSGKARSQVQDFLEAFNDMSSVRPRKQTALSLYSRRFYTSRIKETVESEWAAKTEEERDVPGARLKHSNQTTKSFWNKETEEFRKSLEDESEEYDEAINEAPKILLPLVETLAQYYGMAASILLCGPMSDGKINVRSMHSETKTGRTMMIWPEADPEGFELVEKSFIEYGVKLFTKEEVESRKLTPDSANEGAPKAGTAALLQPTRQPILPAATAALPSQPPTDNGAPSQPPADDGAPSQPPADDGAPSQPPADDGAQQSEQDFPLDPALVAPAPLSAPTDVPSPTTPSSDKETTSDPVNDSPEAMSKAATATEPSTGSPAPTSPSSGKETASQAPAPLQHANRLLAPIQALHNVVIPPKNNEDLDLADLIKGEAKNRFGREWGTEWDVCIRGLLEFEKRHDFPIEGKRMKVQSRPDEYKQWMKSGRKIVDLPISGTFAGEWWSWWRGVKEGDGDSDEEVDWKSVLIPGNSGIFLVVLGLAWWGESIDCEGRAMRVPMSWSAAVCEVTRILWDSKDHEEQENVDPGKKRKTEEQGQGNKQAKRKRSA
ncbi:hypothetical protein H0H92_000567 [Tricholoma furcatifolium]|nr:hypothetical protein H0H92_000567 [Tricholoma furcatifolium]